MYLPIAQIYSSSDLIFLIVCDALSNVISLNKKKMVVL